MQVVVYYSEEQTECFLQWIFINVLSKILRCHGAIFFCQYKFSDTSSQSSSCPTPGHRYYTEHVTLTIAAPILFLILLLLSPNP